MEKLNSNLHKSLKKYYNQVSGMVGLTDIPLNSSDLVKKDMLKEEKELTVSVKQSFFDSIDKVLNVENQYMMLIQEYISEDEFMKILNDILNTSKNLIFDIKNTDLKVNISLMTDDHDNFGVIGIYGIKLLKDNICLMDMSPITNSTMLWKGIPFSMNNYYCSGFITEEGKEYLSNIEHGYRIKFTAI